MPKKTAKKRVIKKEVKRAEEIESVDKISKATQEKNQDKILKWFLIGGLFFIVLVLALAYVVESTTKFEYQGVDFKIVKTGNLVLYNTKIPVIVGGQKADYNFYLRNDPRKLYDEVPFEGNLNLARNLVLNSTEDFNCDGFGVIGVANLVNLYKISGINVIKDGNATCDSDGMYGFINLQRGNGTKIEKTGVACYNINIYNCEILEATERMMLESLIEINKLADEENSG